MKGLAIAALAGWVLIPAAICCAQIQALDPKDAGPDFPYQGEYVGEASVGTAKTPWAAQVSALGDGNFRAVLWTGGLPGSPGHSAASRLQLTGKRSGDKVPFSGSGFTVSLTPVGITGTGPGQAAVNLPRINRQSPTTGLKAPTGATVLFDGTGLTAWRAGAKMDARNLLAVPATTANRFGSFSLHLEVMLPFEPSGRGQGRANSGIILNGGGYAEVQVLDSFGDAPYQDGAGGLYNTAVPLFTGNLPPLTWQTYDINYEAPPSTGDARITVRLNGILVQDRTVMKNRASTTPIEFQDHDHPVFYRNVWILNRSDYDFAQHGTTTAMPWGPRATRPGSSPSPGLERSGGTGSPGPSIRWNGTVLDFLGRTACGFACPERESGL